MKIRPLGDNVLVKQAKVDEVTSFGLVLPGKDEKKPEGEVVAVGPGKMLECDFKKLGRRKSGIR